jgi:DNA-binding MarR family transcriptional regulator
MEANKNSIWLLFEATMRFKPRLIDIAEKYGATVQQLHVVSLFSNDKAHSMSWFASLLACDASNVTGIVDRLHTAGIVERHESEKDRRIKMIALTEKGKKLRSDLIASLAEEEKEITALTEQEKVELVRILSKLLASFENCPNLEK